MSSLNVNFLGLPRVAYGLSQHGLAPQAFSKVDDKGTPRNALYLISAWIALLALSGAFELLLRFMMTIAITVDTIVLLGYFRLRAKRPDMERPFTMPGHPVLPIITIALYVVILAILIGTQPQLALGAGAMLLAILIAGIITTRSRAASGD
jgi:APA family basic amino acid/polyamine antiporter